MFCAFCSAPLGWVHGHGACLRSGCPMFGVNQEPCCQGEPLDECPVEPSPAPRAEGEPRPAPPPPRRAPKAPAKRRRAP